MGDNGFHEFAKATFLPVFGNSNASPPRSADAQAQSVTESAAITSDQAGASELQWAEARIALLESALDLMVWMVDESRSDSEGRYPALVSSCVECTSGVTPNRHNKGPCPYHLAKQLLKTR